MKPENPVYLLKSIRLEINAMCGKEGSRAGKAGAFEVWAHLCDEMRGWLKEWGVIYDSAGSFSAEGGQRGDWNRGLRLLLLCGLVKRSKGGLLVSPRHAYKGAWEGHQGAIAELDKA